MHTQWTAANVAGQSVVPILVAAREGILDREAYESADGSHLEAQPQPAAA